MTWPQFWAEVIPMLASVLLALLSWGLVEGIAFLRRRTRSAAVIEVLKVVDLLADAVVVELQQTTVDGLKKASSDGRLTPEEAVEVKNAALARVKQQIPAALKVVAERYVGSLESYISSRIERAVREMRLREGRERVSLLSPASS